MAAFITAASEKAVNALRKGDVETVKRLLENGADANAYDGIMMRIAVQRADTKVIKLLLDHGADPDANCSIVLHWASNFKYFAIMALLVEHGADYSMLPEFKGVERQRVVELLVAKAVAKEVAA